VQSSLVGNDETIPQWVIFQVAQTNKNC